MSEEAAVEVAQADGRDFVTEEDVKAAEPQERPEWLPEKYKTGEDLANAYKALESKLGTKDEDLRKSIEEELKANALKDRPETAGDYSLPDIVNEELAVDNDLLKWWSDHAFENGYSQEMFEQGIQMYAESAPQVDLSAELEKLGENANARVDAASAFALKTFGKESVPIIERLFESAEGVMMMETMMEAMKDGNFSGAAESTSAITKSDLETMMRDPRYWDRQSMDQNFIKQVDDGFKQLYRG